MNEKIISAIESLLLVANKELTIKKISEILNIETSAAFEALEFLKTKYNQPSSGIQLAVNNEKYQLTTNPANAEIVKKFINDEEKGELTKPSLETLTIIAYRQPITKAEIEQIRGINCGLILRNLMIRGLIETKEDEKKMEVLYYVTMDFLKFLGLNEVKDLPNFAELNSDENLKNLLAKKEDQPEGDKLTI